MFLQTIILFEIKNNHHCDKEFSENLGITQAGVSN